MLKTVLKYLFYGICWGCLFFVGVCVIFDLTGNDAALAAISQNFTMQAVGSILVGIASGSTSILYRFDKPAMWLKILIHFLVGMGVYMAVAVTCGWVSGLSFRQVLLFFLFALVIFALIWCGFYLHSRAEARKMNQQIRRMEGEGEESG